MTSISQDNSKYESYVCLAGKTVASSYGSGLKRAVKAATLKMNLMAEGTRLIGGNSQ